MRSFGKTVGITFGLAWTGKTEVENLSYLIGINGYSQKLSADNRRGSSGGDINETVLNFKLGLAYRF